MNIGDYVYIYLFELEKTIVNMKQLRNDRFGIILDKSIIKCNNGESILSYKIKLLYNDNIIEYKANNLSTNIITLYDLIALINDSNLNEENKDKLLSQIHSVVEK